MHQQYQLASHHLVETENLAKMFDNTALPRKNQFLQFKTENENITLMA